MKRAIDVVGALVGLVVLSPVMLVVALAVRVSMGRPVIFSQRRAGRDGRAFQILKFRTMRAAQPGREGPEHDSERITRLGQILRSTSLDELPELVNVLRGEMSLVGPRPLPTAYLPRYSLEQQRRHDLRPGLTGLAQVTGRNALDWEERLAVDVWYVDHRTLALDLRILMRTIGCVLSRASVDQSVGTTMTEFKGGNA